MIPSCAGTPTGTPADIPTGQAPIVYNSTDKKLCVWDGAAWVRPLRFNRSYICLTFVLRL